MAEISFEDMLKAETSQPSGGAKEVSFEDMLGAQQTPAAAAPASEPKEVSFESMLSTPSTPQPQASKTPEERSKSWAVTRGFVSGMLKENPENTAEAFEGLSHLAPDMFKSSLESGANSLRGVAAAPEGYERQSGSMWDIDSLSGALTWAGETLGSGLASTVPSLVTGGAGALVGSAAGPVGTAVGAVGGALVPSALLNYGEVYKAIKDAGLDAPSAAKWASAATVPIAALDVGSLASIAGRFGGVEAAKKEVIRNLATRIAIQAKGGAKTEGITEALQGAIKDLTVVGVTDKKFDPVDFAKQRAEDFVGGGIVGGTMSAPAGVRKPGSNTPASAEDIAASYENLVTQPLPTAPAPDPTKEVPPVQPPAPLVSAPVVTPFEEMLANAPLVSPTVQHMQNSSPLSSNVDSTVAAIMAPTMEPPANHPVREKALTKPDDDVDATLQAIYEVLDPPALVDPANLTQVGPQLGSNKGGVYSDMKGNNFYYKEAPTPAHETNEKVAAALYKLAGASTLEYVPAKNGIATKLVTLDKKKASELNAQELAKAREDFVVHAWLANWDAVGLGGDNLGTSQGKPVWLDLGGALDFRAKGEPKGAAFGSQVGEMKTLLDFGLNPDAAGLFSGMTTLELAKAATKVVSLSDEEIRATVKNAGGGNALANKLIARRDDIDMQMNNMISSREMPAAKLDKIVEKINITFDPDAPSELPVFEATPALGVDALIESGTSTKVLPDPVGALIDEATKQPNTALTNWLSKSTYFVDLIEANNYPDKDAAKKQIIAHNKKISAKHKKEDGSFYFPLHVNVLAKKWKLYHGTNANPYEKFNDPLKKSHERGIFFTPDKKFADSFGGHVTTYEVEVTPGKTKAVDLAKMAIDNKFLDKVAFYTGEDAKKSPYYKDKPEMIAKIIKDKRQVLEQSKAYEKAKHDKVKQQKKDFYKKYGIPKLLDAPKTGYDWGGIHAAIEEARKEGYDTLVLRNINEGGGHDQIVVLNPNRVFNTKTKKMMFSLSQGGQRFNTSKLTPEAQAQRGALIGTVENLLRQWKNNYENAQIARAAIRQVAGSAVADRTITPGTIAMPGSPSAWGPAAEGVDQVAGFYSPQAETDMALPLIAISVGGSTKRALVTAYHEGWHAVEGTLTMEELAQLVRDTEALREFVIQQNPKDEALYRGAEREEIWAEAAAFYSYAQTTRRVQIYQGPAAGVLQKLHEMFQAIREAVNALGFGRSADIFEKFYQGEMAERRLGLPVSMLERWWAREAGLQDHLAQLYPKLEKATAQNLRALQAIDKGIVKAPAQAETLPLRTVVDKLYSMTHGAPAPVQQALAHADNIAFRHKWMWGLDRLVDINMKFTPLVKYAELIRQMRTDTTNIQDAGQRIAKDWRRLGAQSENLAAFIDEITNMDFRTPQEKQAGVMRHPTAQEFQALIVKHKVGTDALSIFDRQKKFFETFLKLTTQNAVAEAQRVISDPVALMNRIVAIQTKEAELLSRPYFPFLRFGLHYVMVKDAAGQTQLFETYERKGLRSAENVQMSEYKKIKAQLPPGWTITYNKLPETVQPFMGLPPTLLESIQADLMAMPNAAGQAPGLSQAQIDAIEQLRYMASPASSFARRFQNKNYVKGYSHDFMRGFASYVFQGSRYYSRVKYGWALREQLAEAENLAKTTSGNNIGDIASFMNDHFYNTVLDSKGDFGALKGAVFFWVFGFSVAGATLNVSQIPMVTYPWLAAKFGGIGMGDARAMKAIVRAGTQVQNFYKKGSYSATHSAFEMRAIDYGVRTGRISESQAADLAGLSQGQTLLGQSNNKVRQLAQFLNEKGVWFFEMAEQYNRRVTFRAALELAQQLPNSKGVQEAMIKYKSEYDQLVQSGTIPAEARAIVAAVHATEQTQFVYARENRPRFMRGKKGIIFVFQNYMVNILQLMGANPGSVMPRMLIMLLLAGGLMGLPGADELEDIATFLGKHFFGKDFNAKNALRELLVELAGDKADVALHGLARRGWGLPAIMDMLGERPRGLRPPTFGEMPPPGQPWPKDSGHSSMIPVPVLDRSKAISMGRLLPVDIGKILDPTDIDKAIATQTQQASGAVFGVGYNLYRAMMDTSTSMTDLKRWERAMPRALAGASRAYRAYSEGRERSKGGPNSASTVVNYDVRDTEQFAEVIAMGLGYTPLRQSAKWDQIMAETEATKRLQIEQKLVVGNFNEARSGGDAKEIQRAREKMIEFNERLPEWGRGYKITGDMVLRSMESREAERNAREAGIPRQQRNRPIAEHFQNLFPESTVDVRRVR